MDQGYRAGFDEFASTYNCAWRTMCPSYSAGLHARAILPTLTLELREARAQVRTPAREARTILSALTTPNSLQIEAWGEKPKSGASLVT
jgi:hypothetical protein